MHKKQKIFKKKKEIHNTVYRQIQNPEQIRKESLKLAVSSINLLERYENYKEIRKKKQFCMSELRKVFNEIKEGMHEAEHYLPSVKEQHKTKPLLGMRSTFLDIKEKEKVIEEQAQDEEADELGKLHTEVERLKSKLETINI